MASFTEQATLRVVDQSSAQLRKINAELKKLFATAKSLKSFTINIRVNDAGLTRAAANTRQLAAALRTLRSTTVNVRANVSGLAAAQRQITQLRQQASRPITIRTQHAGGGGGPAGPGGPMRPGPGFGGGGYRRTPGMAFIGGAGGGLGIGLGRLNESFGVVALAGYAAAKALSAVATAANARDRAELAVETQTSPAQRAVFDAADKAAKESGQYTGALRYMKNQFNLARSSFLGDVGVSEGVNPQSREGELERAARADLLARTLYRDVVPGMYARNPNLSQVESQEELKKFVQTLGITTQNMFEKDAQGRLQMTADYKRVSEGIRLGQIAAPDLTMGQIRTAAAAIKSLGYTATSQQIAEILFNVSSKGQRAGNEAYQMYKTGLGTVDVGKLNTAIENLGLFLPGTAKRGPKTKKNPEGLVMPGTGIPVEFTDKDTGEAIKLGERPSDWWRAALESPEVQKKIKEQMVDQAVRSLPKGATKAQKAEAEAKARATEPDATVKADFVNRTLAGARGTALQGILDSILGGPVAKAGIAQALNAPGPEEVNRIMTEKWSVQFSNLSTAVSDAAGDLGKLAASALGLSTIFAGMTKFVDQNPLVASSLAIAAATAIGVAVLVPFATLTAAGTGLVGAAAALSSAAAALGGGAAAGAAGGAAGAAGAGRWANVARVGGVLMRFVGGVGIALTAAEIAQYIANRSAEQAKNDETRIQTTKDLAQKEASAARIAQEQKIQEGTPQSPAQQAYMATQATQLEALKVEIARLKEVLAPPKETPAVESQTEAITKAVTEATKAVPTTVEAMTAAVTKAVTDHIQAAKPAPAVAATAAATTPVPTATAAATTAAATPAPDSLAALIPQLAQTSQSITLSVSGLTAAGATFSTVFQTGAAAIGASGQTAADTLSAAAPSIGAAIGNAAAAAISAAAAKVSIQVNHTGEVPNTGKSAPGP